MAMVEKNFIVDEIEESQDKHFGLWTINFCKFHLERKIRVEREDCSSSELVERWMNVARMMQVNGPAMSIRL